MLQVPSGLQIEKGGSWGPGSRTTSVEVRFRGRLQVLLLLSRSSKVNQLHKLNPEKHILLFLLFSKLVMTTINFLNWFAILLLPVSVNSALWALPVLFFPWDGVNDSIAFADMCAFFQAFLSTNVESSMHYCVLKVEIFLEELFCREVNMYHIAGFPVFHYVNTVVKRKSKQKTNVFLLVLM